MIVSFYSYKGGVGRTQLCANVAAYLCYHKKKRVLVWDWDYEAPGIHYFFRKKNGDITKQGTLELLESYMSLMRSSKEKVQIGDLKYITQDNITQLEAGNEGCIDLMAAGIYDSTFSFRATNFDWFEFYNMLDGVNYIEQLKEHLKKLNYDYILIDSRTGISDYSGICNIQLPDVNVMVIAATMQNFEGCKSIIDKIQNAEYLKIVGREARILPVLSRLDTGSSKYNEWAQRFKQYFSATIKNLDKDFDELFLNEVFTYVYYRDTFIPYTQSLSAGENVRFDESSNKDDTDVDSRPFRNIAEYLDDINRNKSIQFYKSIGERDWLRYAAEAESPRKAAIAYTQVAIKQSDADDVILYCEKAINEDIGYYLPYYHVAIAFSTKSDSFKAIHYLKEALVLNPKFTEASYLLATEYLNIGKPDLGEIYLIKTLDLNPDHVEASKKLLSLKNGTIAVNELKAKEDEFINTYVNTQIEESKQKTEIYAEIKIKRSKRVAYISLLFTAISILIFLITFFTSPIKNDKPAVNKDILYNDSINLYQKLSDSLTNIIKATGINDTAFQLTTAKDVEKLNQLYDSLNNNYFWVFLGQKTGKAWSLQNFEFDDIRSIGPNLTATNDVYKRTEQPKQQQDTSWKLGRIIGLVSEGQTIRIEKIDSVKLTRESTTLNFWALANENNSDFWAVILTTHHSLDTARNLFNRFKKNLHNLRIIRNDKYFYITAQNFDTQINAQDYISKNKKFLPKDTYVIKLSEICNRMTYQEFYFDCR